MLEEPRGGSQDDPGLSHGSYRSPHLPSRHLPSPPASAAPNYSAPPPKTRLSHSSYPGRCSSTAASLQAKLQCRKGRAFILFFFIPPEAFVEVSQSQGKIPLPGLPAQHPGKFLQPSLEQHLWATLITGRELESSQMSLTTLWFVREPNQTARVVRASPRRCTA